MNAMTETAVTAANRYGSDAERWDAVCSRDRSADGSFFYSVRTTGVYCRPSCAARLAHRENVQFHLTCAAAEQAGFRPCLRCRPNEQPLAQRQAAVIAAACRSIDQAQDVPSLDDLANGAGMSRFHFHRVFKAVAGVTPKAYADAARAQRVRNQLEGGAKVTAAIYDAGFNSNAPFYGSSNGLLGMTPSAFRGGGSGESIRFAVGECWLGSILVAATDKGICAISFGDDPERLVHDLQDRFAQAKLIGADATFEQSVAKVIAFVEAPAVALDLPLDIRGSVFQRRVWQALREIKPGSTASYAEIAQRIGQPRAVRAVAQACATNPVALAIPCHRVIRTDGSLSGYRWGVERKRALLERESAK